MVSHPRQRKECLLHNKPGKGADLARKSRDGVEAALARRNITNIKSITRDAGHPALVVGARVDQEAGIITKRRGLRK